MIDNTEVLITRSYPIPVAVIGRKSASTMGKLKAKELLKKHKRRTLNG